MGVGTDLMAGTVSGMSASLAGQPLDTVRVRLQSRGHLYSGTVDTVVRHRLQRRSFRAFFGAVSLIVGLIFGGRRQAKTFKADGARGFFRGAVPPLLGMGPKNAIGFGAHGAALRFLEGGGDMPTVELKRSASMGNVALAGCAAGMAQCAVVVPSDRIKCQLQVQTGAGSSALSAGAVRDCLRTLIREDGLGPGLLRGWWPTFWRQTLSAPVYFGSYEALKRASASTSASASTPLTTMMCGGIAGVCAYASTYPFDILKSYAHAAPPGAFSHFSIGFPLRFHSTFVGFRTES